MYSPLGFPSALHLSITLVIGLVLSCPEHCIISHPPPFHRLYLINLCLNACASLCFRLHCQFQFQFPFPFYFVSSAFLFLIPILLLLLFLPYLLICKFRLLTPAAIWPRAGLYVQLSTVCRFFSFSALPLISSTRSKANRRLCSLCIFLFFSQNTTVQARNTVPDTAALRISSTSA